MRVWALGIVCLLAGCSATRRITMPSEEPSKVEEPAIVPLPVPSPVITKSVPVETAPEIQVETKTVVRPKAKAKPIIQPKQAPILLVCPTCPTCPTCPSFVCPACPECPKHKETTLWQDLAKVAVSAVIGGGITKVITTLNFRKS